MRKTVAVTMCDCNTHSDLVMPIACTGDYTGMEGDVCCGETPPVGDSTTGTQTAQSKPIPFTP